MKIFAASLALALAIAVQADPVTVSGNTIGDLVSVNVNIKADIRNDVHQHFAGASNAGAADLGDIWDRIQEVVGKLPVTSQPQVEGEVAPETPKVEGDKLVEQLLGLLSGNPTVWEKLQPLMNQILKVDADQN